ITKARKQLKAVLPSNLQQNQLQKQHIIYTSSEKKGKLFQGTLVEVTVYPKESICDEIKTYLSQVINGLGLEVNFEVSKTEERTTIKMYSDNNPILIGRNGQTIKAMESLVTQMLQSKYGFYFKVSLDVENYKVKKEKNLARMAWQMAKEVVRTNMPIEMDNMTSYERRIVHNALTEFRGVITESEGEEPNRHIVIKPE
ncbi:MAG: KH domain-containing protein, partial [Bacilli bacterium]|nr:KH domain-containing protein [Bacilli bacterium]